MESQEKGSFIPTFESRKAVNGWAPSNDTELLYRTGEGKSESPALAYCLSEAHTGVDEASESAGFRRVSILTPSPPLRLFMTLSHDKVALCHLKVECQ